MTTRPGLLIALVTLGLLTTIPAAAQNAAVAESLFREAREAMKAGDYETACPKLRESQRLEPSAGATLNLAVCEQRSGRLATAWSLFREIVDTLSADDERRSLALRHLAELEPLVPRLRVITESGLDSRTFVRLDGVVMHEASLLTEWPLDPGEHVIELVGHDGVLQRDVVNIGPAERRVHRLVPRVPVASVTEPPSSVRRASMPRGGSSGIVSRQMDTTSQPTTSKRIPTASYVAGGLAVTAFMASLAFGGMALYQKGVVRDHCPDRRCDATGARAADAGRRDIALADVGLAVGIVGLGLATIITWSSVE